MIEPFEDRLLLSAALLPAGLSALVLALSVQEAETGNGTKSRSDYSALVQETAQVAKVQLILEETKQERHLTC